MKKIVVIVGLILSACSPKNEQSPNFETKVEALATFEDTSTALADFGNPATASTTRIFTFKNIGDSAGPGTATLTGTNATSFSIILQTGCATVNVGSSCTVRVNFNPSGKAVGSYTADLNIGGTVLKTLTATVAAATTGGSTTGGSTGGTTGGTTSGGTSTIEASISGVAISNPLDYGSFTGTQTSTKIITLKNTGTVSTGPHTAALSDGDFTFTLNSCSSKTLAPNGTCSVRITFNSTSKTAGEYLTDLTFGTSSFPLKATVAGAGTTTGGSTTGGTTGGTTSGGAAVISFLDGTTPISSPYSIGSTTTTSITKIITIKNTGTVSTGPHTAALSDTDITFTLNSCSSKTLAPNGSCTVRVTFNPTSKTPGEHGSTLTFGTGSIDLTATKSGLVCNSGEHIEGGVCVSDTQSCTIVNGIGQKTWNGSSYGSCQIVSCNLNFEQVNNQCMSQCTVGKHRDPISLFCVNDTRNCNPMPTNANAGTQTWNSTTQVWGSCNVTGCIATFHTEDNLSCVSNVRSCTTALPSNATTGEETWNGTWGDCVATACENTHLLLGTGSNVGCYLPLGVSPDNTAGVISVNPGEIINFSASGGLAPYSFSFDSNNPAGLGSSIGSSNGVYLAGVSIGGVTNEYVVVSDALGQSLTVTLVVQPAAISISPLTVTLDGTQNQQFSTTGGFNPITFRIDPASTISSSISATGLYTAGTNNTALAITETIVAEDSQGNEVSAQVTINPSGTVTDVYSVGLADPNQYWNYLSGVTNAPVVSQSCLPITITRYKNNAVEQNPTTAITVSVQSSNPNKFKFYTDNTCANEISQPVSLVLAQGQSVITYPNYIYMKIEVSDTVTTKTSTNSESVTVSSSDSQYETRVQNLQTQPFFLQSYPIIPFSYYGFYHSIDPIYSNSAKDYATAFPVTVSAGDAIRPLRTFTQVGGPGVSMSLVESGALIPSLYKQENYSNVYYRTDTLQISVGNSSSSNNLSFSISDSNNNTVTGMSMTIVPGGDYPTVQNFIFGYRYSCAIIENKLYCWGAMGSYQLRNMIDETISSNYQYKPVQIKVADVSGNIKEVVLSTDGENRTCVITTADEFYCNNGVGNFIKVSGAGEVVTKAFITPLGGYCRVRNDNTMLCTGGFVSTPSSIPSGTIHEVASNSAVNQGSYETFILIGDKVYTWIGTNTPVIVPQWNENVTHLAANDGIVCVVKSGAVQCKHGNSGGFYTLVNSNFSSGVSKVSTYGFPVEKQVCALKTNNSLHCMHLLYDHINSSMTENLITEVASVGQVSELYSKGGANCFKYTNGLVACAPFAAYYSFSATYGNSGWLSQQGHGPHFFPIVQNVLYENNCGWGAYKDGGSCVCRVPGLTYNSSLGICHPLCSNDPNATFNPITAECSCTTIGNAFASSFDYITNTCTQDCGTNGVFDAQSNSCSCTDPNYIFDSNANGIGCRPNCEAGGGTWNNNMSQCECFTGAWDGTTCSTSCPNPDDFWVQGVNSPPPLGCQSTCSNLSTMNGECGEASSHCDIASVNADSYCVPSCSSFISQGGCETNNCLWDTSTNTCRVNCSIYNNNNDICGDYSSEIGQSCEPFYNTIGQECGVQCSTIADETECSSQAHCTFSGSCMNSYELGCTSSGGSWNTPPGECSCPVDTTWNYISKTCEGAGGDCSMHGDPFSCSANSCTWSPYTYPCSTYDNNESACNNAGTCSWTFQMNECSNFNNDMTSCNSYPGCSFFETDPENNPGMGDCSGQYQDSLSGTCSGTYEVGGECQ